MARSGSGGSGGRTVHADPEGGSFKDRAHDSPAMSKRCARCGEFNPRRTLRPDGDWVDYLVRERGASEPVGTLIVPLCNGDYAEARDLGDADEAETRAFLDELDLDLLVDEVAG